MTADEHDRRSEPRDDAALRAHRDALFTLARAAEMHDSDTGAHLLRIRSIVECLACAVGIDDAEAVGYDAMLHDVGKLTIPANILQKPGPLSDEERAIIESHTIAGERMLSWRPSLLRAARIARSHHERWDGTGYPDGLRGEAIPIEARITAAADILDALVADRSYKPAWSYADAFNEAIAQAGAALDPELVRALLECDARNELKSLF